MRSLRALLADRTAAFAIIVLTVVVAMALVGPGLLADDAIRLNLRARNAAPFSLEHGPLFILGADPLGRSLLARIVVAARTTVLIAAAATCAGFLIGCLLGIVAGYFRGWFEIATMRLADAIMSFPGLLLAVVVLYLFGSSVFHLVLVLALIRVPLYLRVTRAEVLEIRQRAFVDSARVIGMPAWRIILRHIVPIVRPTVLTLATLDFAMVMLVESGLSFLGIGIQPPEFTWGLMVAQGRPYLQTAWWVSVLPGLAIMLTAMSANLLAGWLRGRLDPTYRARLEAEAQ